MSLKEWVKERLFRLRIFLWYIVTEPFREVYTFLYYITQALNKTIYWFYYILFAAIIALFLGKRIEFAIVMVLLFAFLMMWEWRSGFFMHRYRQVQKKKIKKVLKEKESKLVK